MKLIDRIKKDKKFRTNVIIGVVIVLFLLSATNKQPLQATWTPQATCDGDLTHDSCVADGCYWLEKASSKDSVPVLLRVGTIGTTTITGCLAGAGLGTYGGPLAAYTIPAGCVIGGSSFFVGSIWSTGIIGEGIDWVVGIFTSPCYQCVHDGYITDKADSCCSGEATYIEMKSLSGVDFLTNNAYVCLTPKSGDECSSWQKPFRSILDSVWKGNSIDNCSTKAWIVIGAGLLLLLVVI